jgi:hypothetical protein
MPGARDQDFARMLRHPALVDVHFLHEQIDRSSANTIQIAVDASLGLPL